METNNSKINLEPVDMQKVKEKIMSEMAGHYAQELDALRSKPVDLNNMPHDVEYQDLNTPEDFEEFVPVPLSSDQIEELPLDLKQFAEDPPATTAGDILYSPQRKYAISETVAQPAAAVSDYDSDEIHKPVAEINADENVNLITSECENGNHAPVIDIDLPIHVYPSSQLGHYHLYVNKEMSWDDYVELLTALAKAGIVEEGYANASIARGYSAVRPVGVQKIDAPRGAYVLKENAEFRKLIYELRQLLEYQTAKADQAVDWDLVNERNQLANTAKELYEENQKIQYEANQLREELNRARLQQANTASISWS